MTITGLAQPQFEAVAQSFENNFLRNGDIGAACAVFHKGKPVVDLWGGMADPDSGRTWRQDTPVMVFSATKGVTATAILSLVDQGLLDIDAPVCRYWPEFAANGKDQITTRMVLGHRAGVAAIDAQLSLDQVLTWEPVIDAIAAQKPNWQPDTRHGYHARTFGWILGELIRRITSKTAGEYCRDTFFGPRDLDFHIGCPPSVVERCATLIPPTSFPPPPAGITRDSLYVRVMTGPSGLFGYNAMWNRADILAAEMPSSNGVGTARALAGFYAAITGDSETPALLSAPTLARACQVQSNGPDAVILRDTCFGLGYSLPPMLSEVCGPGAFGHPGAGGALAFADPENQLTFAYVTNSLQFHEEADPRSRDLVAEVYSCLGK